MRQHAMNATPARQPLNKNLIAGIAILSVIILCIIAMFALRQCSFGMVKFAIRFDDVKGLEVGDNIYMRGVKIGDVRRIAIEGDRVVVQVAAESQYPLPNDSFFFIWSDKLISGKKCIQVKPGVSPVAITRRDVLDGESSYHDILLENGANWLKSQGLL